MLFSRRKRGTRVEPVVPETSAPANGAAPVDTRNETPSVDASAAPGAVGDATTTVATPANGMPTVPVAASSATPTSDDVDDRPEGLPLARGDETGDADLDRFFAALRQVVHDARERVPLDTADVAADEPESGRMQDDADDGAMSAGTMVPTRPDPFTTTELAPSTAELIASLEDDRNLWRERAVVWRERALGADMMVKALNAHMSDLRFNVEDLRMAMRAMSANSPGRPEPRAELPAQSPRRSGLDLSLEPGE